MAAKRESAAVLAARDRLDSSVLFAAVTANFPGAVFAGSFDRNNVKDVRCDGVVSGQTGRIPCGNSPIEGGILCAGPCRKEGRG